MKKGGFHVNGSMGKNNLTLLNNSFSLQLKDDNETIILFDPPVYIQRYSAVVSEIFDYPNYKRV